MGYRIAIVGGGAAGMMAAVFAAKNRAEVFLLERNPMLGRKVLISGGGRCNVTTGLNDLKEVLKKYPRGKNFLRTAMYAFPPDQVFKWVEEHGVALKIEKDLRVFPVSNRGSDVVGAFSKALAEAVVKTLLKTLVKKISKNPEGKFVLELADGDPLIVDKLILTTGGTAYQQTGSVGDGYIFAKDLGHTITDLAPSLNSYLVEENWVKELAGVSFQDVKLKFIGKEKNEFSGPILFTHKGVSGPAVFALSSLAAFENFDEIKPAKLFIDFAPKKNYDEIMKEILNSMRREPQKTFQNTFGGYIPKSLAKTFFDICEIDGEKRNADLSHKLLNKLVEKLKNTQLTLIGKAAGEEFVTAGGVSLDEVDQKTMQSKICPGLYFAGEILDIDGFTGGFNLQVAWCTGKLAGEDASKSL